MEAEEKIYIRLYLFVNNQVINSVNHRTLIRMLMLRNAIAWMYIW